MDRRHRGASLRDGRFVASTAGRMALARRLSPAFAGATCLAEIEGGRSHRRTQGIVAIRGVDGGKSAVPSGTQGISSEQVPIVGSRLDPSRRLSFRSRR